jgi:hypothetical protein
MTNGTVSREAPMQRREFLQSAAAAGAGWMLADNLSAGKAAPAPATDKLIGMYVHQHWPYRHPYAARTWTYDDWHGYLDGLSRLGFNLVLIWPVQETMPNPPTPSDRANLDKIRRVIEAAHHDFHMKVWIAQCPNVAAIDAAAAKVPFEKRHFFYCDRRVNPADAKEMDAMMAQLERVFTPLAQADGVTIIDSDPGSYPDSTNAEFIELLMRYRRLFDKLRPGRIEMLYWLWAGWPAYGRWYAGKKFTWGTDAEFLEVLTALKRRNPEPWGLARGLELAQKLGLESRVINLNYGAIEGEPSFPMTNFGGQAAYQAGRNQGPRGTLGNAQSHCLQLPNTLAFARGARGLPLGDRDYVQFANDLIPGRGELIFSAWQALGGSDSRRMRQVAGELLSWVQEKLEPGPLRGLLFGDANRFLKDLYLMLRTRAGLMDFLGASRQNRSVIGPYAELVEWAERWQLVHGFEGVWGWGDLEAALQKLNCPSLKAFFSETVQADTPWNRIQAEFYAAETPTTRLLRAMKQSLWELDPRYPDSSARFTIQAQ